MQQTQAEKKKQSDTGDEYKTQVQANISIHFLTPNQNCSRRGKRRRWIRLREKNMKIKEPRGKSKLDRITLLVLELLCGFFNA